MLPTSLWVIPSQTGLPQSRATDAQQLVTNLIFLAGNLRQGAKGVKRVWDEKSKIRVQIKMKAASLRVSHPGLFQVSLHVLLGVFFCVPQVPGTSPKLRYKPGFFTCVCSPVSSTSSSIPSIFFTFLISSSLHWVKERTENLSLLGDDFEMISLCNILSF